MKKGMLMVVASCAGLGLVAAPEWAVTVDVQTVRGPVKAMNAVNNGPTKPRSDQSRGNFDAYAALKIPYARGRCPRPAPRRRRR